MVARTDATLVATTMGVSGRYLATRVTGSREDVMTNMIVAPISNVA